MHTHFYLPNIGVTVQILRRKSASKNYLTTPIKSAVIDGFGGVGGWGAGGEAVVGWVDLFNTESSLERYWWVPGSQEMRGVETNLYATLSPLE